MTAYVALEGDLDVHNRDAIEKALPPAHSVERVIVDCTKVTYMDTVALGVLVKYRGTFAWEHGDSTNPPITIVLPPGPLRKIFEIVGFMRLFDVVESHQGIPSQ